MDKSENYTFLNNEQIKCLNLFGFRYNRHKHKYEKIVYSGIYKFILCLSLTILPRQNKYGTKELYYSHNIIPMKKYRDTYVLITNDSDKISEEYITVYEQQSAYISTVINKLKRLHHEFISKNSMMIFENNKLIDFMNNLIDILKEVE